MMQTKKMVQKMRGISICILLFTVFSNCNFILSQYKNRCSFSEHKFSRRQLNPSLLRLDSINEAMLMLKMKENSSVKRGKLFIPVVVHVLWNTPDQNISDAQIQSQIDVLNQDYNRQNLDLLPENHPFYLVGGGLDIHFFLAELDPNNRPTFGVVRKQTSVTAWEDNDEMKSSATAGDDYWDSRKYLNIYVVKFKDDLGLLGYAWPPSDLASYPETDGVVIDYRAFGTIGTAGSDGFDGYVLGRTTTHEVGHWLNLNHIWGDKSCGDDLVNDTPIAEDQNKGNPIFPWRPQNKCGSDQNGEMFMNYMDYVYDNSMNMFTKEQVKRMYNSVVQFRPQLLKNDYCSDFTISVDANYCEGSTSTLKTDRSRGQWFTSDTLKAKVTQNGNIAFLKGGSVNIGYELKQNSSCPMKKVFKDIFIVEKFNGQISQDKDTLKINVSDGKTIQWFNCDQKELILANSSSKNYLPIKSGNYGVIVSSNACRDTSLCFTIKLLLMSELNPLKINVHPNPACSHLNIEMDKDFLNLNAEIIDNMGKVVDSFVLYPHQKQYPIKLNKGHYSLKIIAKEGIVFLSRLLVE